MILAAFFQTKQLIFEKLFLKLFIRTTHILNIHVVKITRNRICAVHFLSPKSNTFDNSKHENTSRIKLHLLYTDKQTAVSSLK